MISPEILRRYPIFFGFDDGQLKALAMIAEEVETAEKVVLFEEAQPATTFYLLMEGSIDLTIKSEEENDPRSRRDFNVGEINPGEIFGITSVLEPNAAYRLSARTGVRSKYLEFDGAGLRALLIVDRGFAYQLMVVTTKSLMERLHSAQIQLAAAWS